MQLVFAIVKPLIKSEAEGTHDGSPGSHPDGPEAYEIVRNANDFFAGGLRTEIGPVQTGTRDVREFDVMAVPQCRTYSYELLEQIMLSHGTQEKG